jgi:hypothetical protein
MHLLGVILIVEGIITELESFKIIIEAGGYN